MADAERDFVRWAFLGTSFISGVMLKAIADVSQGDISCVSDGDNCYNRAKLVVIAGRRQEAIDKFAADHEELLKGVDRSVGFDAVIERPDVDVVYIALPNHVHAEYVTKCAEKGKAVLCEKSFSIDMPSTRLALEAVSKHNIFCQEGLMYLHHPFIHRTLATCLQQRTCKIGSIRYVSAQYAHKILHLTNPRSKGAIYNLGCYPVSLLLYCLGVALGPDFDVHDCTFQGRIGRGCQEGLCCATYAGWWKPGLSYPFVRTGTGNLDQHNNVVEASANIRFKNGLLARLFCAEPYGDFHTEFTIIGEHGDLRITSNPFLPHEGDGNALTVRYTHPEGNHTIVEAETFDAAGKDAFHYQTLHVNDAVVAWKRNGRTNCAYGPSLQHSVDVMTFLTRWETCVRSSLAEA